MKRPCFPDPRPRLVAGSNTSSMPSTTPNIQTPGRQWGGSGSRQPQVVYSKIMFYLKVRQNIPHAATISTDLEFVRLVNKVRCLTVV